MIDNNLLNERNRKAQALENEYLKESRTKKEVTSKYNISEKNFNSFLKEQNISRRGKKTEENLREGELLNIIKHKENQDFLDDVDI